MTTGHGTTILTKKKKKKTIMGTTDYNYSETGRLWLTHTIRKNVYKRKLS